jgi:hypothetical protein
MTMPIENRFTDFFAEYGNRVFYVIIALLALFFLIFRYTGSQEAQAIGDYISADSNLTKFRATPASEILNPDGPFETLTNIIARHPELHQKYDGLIAQILVAKGQPQIADSFANPTFNRIEKDHLPLYLDYAKASLLSSKGLYEEALKSSLTLKEQLSKVKEDSHDETLKAYNLLRIAFLNQQLGHEQDEKLAWKEFDSWVKSASQDLQGKKIWASLQSNFQQGGISLVDYIKIRLTR